MSKKLVSVATKCIALVLAAMLMVFLMPQPVHADPATIQFDAKSSSQSTGVSSIQWSHTVGNYTNRILIVCSAVEDASTWDITGITYNGDDFTLAKKQVVETEGYRSSSEIWYLLNPDIGTYNIQVNYNGSVQDTSVGAVSFYNVRQQAPNEATNSSTATSTDTISTSITTLSDGAMVIDCVSTGDGRNFTPDSGQTEFFDENTGGASGAGSYKTVASAGSTSMGQTASSSTNRLSHCVAAFAPYPNWESYSDSGHSTQCDYFDDYPSEHNVYMYGSGFATSTQYRVVFWDGAGDKAQTEDPTSDEDGNLEAAYEFAAGDTDGNWQCAVYDSTSYSPSSYDPDDSHIVADDTSRDPGDYAFYMEPEAIPEFPTVIAGIAVAGLCFGIYYWMRRRLKLKVQSAKEI